MVRKVQGEKVVLHLIHDLQKALDNKTNGATIIRMLEQKAKQLHSKDYYKVTWYDDKKPNKYSEEVFSFIVNDEKILIREDMILEE
jgi:glucan phosphorylase